MLLLSNKVIMCYYKHEGHYTSSKVKLMCSIPNLDALALGLLSSILLLYITIHLKKRLWQLNN